MSHINPDVFVSPLDLNDRTDHWRILMALLSAYIRMLEAPHPSPFVSMDFRQRERLIDGVVSYWTEAYVIYDHAGPNTSCYFRGQFRLDGCLCTFLNILKNEYFWMLEDGTRHLQVWFRLNGPDPSDFQVWIESRNQAPSSRSTTSSPSVQYISSDSE